MAHMSMSRKSQEMAQVELPDHKSILEKLEDKKSLAKLATLALFFLAFYIGSKPVDSNLKKYSELLDALKNKNTRAIATTLSEFSPELLNLSSVDFISISVPNMNSGKHLRPTTFFTGVNNVNGTTEVDIVKALEEANSAVSNEPVVIHVVGKEDGADNTQESITISLAPEKAPVITTSKSPLENPIPDSPEA